MLCRAWKPINLETLHKDVEAQWHELCVRYLPIGVLVHLAENRINLLPGEPQLGRPAWPEGCSEPGCAVVGSTEDREGGVLGQGSERLTSSIPETRCDQEHRCRQGLHAGRSPSSCSPAQHEAYHATGNPQPPPCTEMERSRNLLPCTLEMQVEDRRRCSLDSGEAHAHLAAASSSSLEASTSFFACNVCRSSIVNGRNSWYDSLPSWSSSSSAMIFLICLSQARQRIVMLNGNPHSKALVSLHHRQTWCVANSRFVQPKLCGAQNVLELLPVENPISIHICTQEKLCATHVTSSDDIVHPVKIFNQGTRAMQWM